MRAELPRAGISLASTLPHTRVCSHRPAPPPNLIVSSFNPFAEFPGEKLLKGAEPLYKPIPILAPGS